MSEGTKAALRWWGLRLALIPVIFFVVATVLHILLYGPFGEDLCETVLGPGADCEEVAAELGLNDPWPERYWDWLSHAARGDFGESWVTQEPVELLDRQKLEVTLLFVLVAMPTAIGTTFALRALRRLSTLWQVLTTALASLPFFAVATMIIILPSRYWNYALPVGSLRFWDDPWDVLRLVVPPALFAGVIAGAISCCGAAMRREIRPGALRLALATSAIALPIVLSANIVAENIFSIRGYGSTLYYSAFTRDYPVLHLYSTVAIGGCIILWLFVPRTQAAPAPSVSVRVALRSPLMIAALAVVLIYAIAAAIGPYVMPYDPRALSQSERFEGPSWSHWLGTNRFGSDLLTILVEGARPALKFAGIVGVLGWLPGAIVGALFAQRWPSVSKWVPWATDWVYFLPGVVVAGILFATDRFDYEQYVVAWAVLAFLAGVSSGTRAIAGHSAEHWHDLIAPIAAGLSGVLAAAVMLHTTLAFLGFWPEQLFEPSWAGAFHGARESLRLFPLYAVTACVFLITFAFAYISIRLGARAAEPSTSRSESEHDPAPSAS